MQLLITSLGFLFSAFLIFAFASYVFLKREKLAHYLYVLFNIFVGIFALIFVLAINTKNQSIASFIWMFSAVDILIVVFYVHWVLEVLGLSRSRRHVLRFLYGVGALLLAAILVYPKEFIVDSAPKLYLLSYPVPGPLYNVMVVFFAVFVLYSFGELLLAYFKRKEERNRLWYVFLASTFGYVLGGSAFLLVWDLPIDPALAMFFGFYSVLFFYAMAKGKLMDIRVAFKRAGFSVLVIGGSSWLIFESGSINLWLVQEFPQAPPFLIPILGASLAFLVGLLFWQKNKEADNLKSEFISIAAHRFRVPLTRIKFATNSILSEKNFEEKNLENLLFVIERENNHLIDLVDTLLLIADSNASSRSNYEVVNVHFVLEKVLNSFREKIKEKRIVVGMAEDKDLPMIELDPRQMNIVFGAILDNAIKYTPAGGQILISFLKQDRKVIISFADSGIGIAKENLPFLTSKFYRGKEAVRMEVDGAGLSLFLAKKILEAHRGDLLISSRGHRLGTTVKVVLPLYRRYGKFS